MDTNMTNQEFFNRALRSIPGGADSSMRVMPYQKPLAVSKADGAFIYDVSCNRLIDMNMGYGPLIFGHRPAFLLKAIKEELDIRGTVLGFPHELSHLTAEFIKICYPSIDMLRFASTGTEVDQTAVRLARAFTKKTHLVIFEGHYHGSTDSVFHSYHAELEDLKTEKPPSGTGGMNGAPFNCYLLPWNDIQAVEEFLKKNGSHIAALIMEPVMGNASVIPPEKDFLSGVRDLTKKHNVLLIFDEVITGCRIARGGAQERYGVQADITTLSKAMNGGVPVSAVGGKKDIMELLSSRVVFHGGVYSGHPMSMAGALATQREIDLRKDEIYPYLNMMSQKISDEVRSIFSRKGIPVYFQAVGAMLGMAFLNDRINESINDYRSLKKNILFNRYVAFQHALQDRGVFIHPNCYEPWYLSTAHSSEVIDMLLSIIKKTVEELNWNKI